MLSTNPLQLAGVVSWAVMTVVWLVTLSIVPRMEAPTFWEQVYLPLCCLVFIMRLRIGEVNQEGSAAAYANGAFMLVRRSAYEALGGHARVRDQLNDDIALAHLAKTEGYCLRIAASGEARPPSH